MVEEIGGFPTLMQANAFARRYVREFGRRCRVPGVAPKDVLEAWFAYGEDAEVVDARRGGHGAAPPNSAISPTGGRRRGTGLACARPAPVGEDGARGMTRAPRPSAVRPGPTGSAACRRGPGRARERPVRAPARRASSCCASTTPIAERCQAGARARRSRSDLRLARHRLGRPSSTSPIVCDSYEDAAERLKQAGRLYPCFESEEELRAKREMRIRRGQPPVYDRAMLKLTAEQRAAAEAGGKRPVLALPALRDDDRRGTISCSARGR